MRQAVALIADSLGLSFNPLIDAASLYETHPILGTPDSFPFLNSVIRIRTHRDPRNLLDMTQSIEDRLGRVRTRHWGPRTIDIDLLFFEDRVIHETGLTSPHAHMHERRFVLEPMRELAFDFVHPLLGLTMDDLCRREGIARQHVVRIQGADWVHG
jgi:2-amino-4-hydroxy-6-hydroxymethyldihydropteridine diphosphokinase